MKGSVQRNENWIYGIASVLVVAISVAVLWPIFVTQRGGVSLKRGSIGQYKMLATSLAMYMGDSGNICPSIRSPKDLDVKLHNYLKNKEVEDLGKEAAWNSKLFNVKIPEPLPGTGPWVFHSPPINDEGEVIFGFCDFSVKVVKAEDLESALENDRLGKTQ